MKTTTDLFVMFTTGRKETYQNGDNETFNSAKFYDLSPKQSKWICDLIYTKFKSVKNGNNLVSAEQYSENINGYSYSLRCLKTKTRIMVWQLPN